MVLFQVHRAAALRQCHHGENPNRVIAGQIPACARVSDRSSYGRQLCAAASVGFRPVHNSVSFQYVRRSAWMARQSLGRRSVYRAHNTSCFCSGYRIVIGPSNSMWHVGQSGPRLSQVYTGAARCISHPIVDRCRWTWCIAIQPTIL